MRSERAPSSHASRFLYVGPLSEKKGLNTLLNAFTKVRDRLPVSRLVLVGGGTLLKALQAQARALGVAHTLEFTGGMGQAELVEQYLQATCLVLPCRSNEALHYGCSVVVSDYCGCLPELVVDGVTGFGFTAGDADELAEKLFRLTHELADAEPVAERCLEVISNFTPEVSARQIRSGCRATTEIPAMTT